MCLNTPRLCAVLLIGSAMLWGAAAQADTITQWHFNSPLPDTNPSTGTWLPSVGSGQASAVGGTTATFASGDATGGSSDPATGDDSALNISGFGPQGTATGTRGVQFQLSTVGFDSIILSYDIRHSPTSPKHEVFQYALDGVHFVDLLTVEAPGADLWRNGRTVDLSDVPGTSHNPQLAFRVMAATAPDTLTYEPTGEAANYSALGAWRLDAFTVYGAPAAPVPEPSTWALLCLGMGLVFMRVAFRRYVFETVL